MKFKYNFLENRCWRIEGKSAYEISERYLLTKVLTTSNDFRWNKNHILTFQSILWTSSFYASYTKPLKNGELTYYQRKIVGKWERGGVITFEFTEADNWEKDEQGYYWPKPKNLSTK